VSLPNASYMVLLQSIIANFFQMSSCFVLLVKCEQILLWTVLAESSLSCSQPLW